MMNTKVEDTAARGEAERGMRVTAFLEYEKSVTECADALDMIADCLDRGGTEPVSLSERGLHGLCRTLRHNARQLDSVLGYFMDARDADERACLAEHQHSQRPTAPDLTTRKPAARHAA